MINLPNVTLLALSSIEIPATIKALEKSCEGINFGAVKLISHRKPDDLPKNIQFKYCNEIKSIDEFNILVFKYLGQYVQTSHCLMVQYHGYVINPLVWDNDWLNYDYCGALWPLKEDAYIAWGSREHVRIGNGGFSLRSKKLLDIPLKHDLPLLQEQGWYNEDGNLNCYYREVMLALGIEYTPIEIAAKFSYENPIPENQNIDKFFGFHRNDPRSKNGK